MSDKVLRAGLIRLAHSHPEFRAELLPLLQHKQLPTNAPGEVKLAFGDSVSGVKSKRLPRKYASQEASVQLGLYVVVQADNFKKSRQGMSFSGEAQLYTTEFGSGNPLLSDGFRVSYAAVLDPKTFVFTVKAKAPMFEVAIQRALARAGRYTFDWELEKLGLLSKS